MTYRHLYIFTITFYCLILTQFGFENFDTGYIPSFSWRIINGQDVYQDFIYKGPPVTLYFHAFFMKILPEVGQFFLIRIIFYLLFALQIFFTISGFYNCYDFNKIRVNKWAVMTVCFIISLLNFSPYPWPTTDGVLFASVAFWLVSKYKVPNFFTLLFIAFFTVLSALTKQSFYLIPILFLFWIFIKYDLKKALVFLSQIVFWLGIYICFIFSITDFNTFLKQTTGETHLHDLFYSGVHFYIFVSILYFSVIVGFLGTIFFGYLHFTKQKIEILSPIFKVVVVSVFSLAIIVSLFKEIPFASRIAFDASVLAVLYAFVFDKKTITYLAPILVLLGIAWSSSISMGYPYPILCLAGIILSFLILMEKHLTFNSKWYFRIALPVCLMAFSYNYRPYREATIFNLRYSLESVSPKLKFIKTSKQSFNKYSELKQLVNKYGKNFIVAPNIPMANYLFNNQSKLPADWIIETEVNRQQKRFIKIASDKKNYIFLEKSFLEKEECMPEIASNFSSISWFIFKNFNKIEETNYFIIYNSLKKNERLP
jgi:hypothetical protein